MATKKTTTTRKPAQPKAAKKAPATTKQAAAQKKPKTGGKRDGKMSALDAAAKVLTEAGEPLTAKAMIEAMATKGYWTSPSGKTPHSTLYAAIIREIATKGTESRFQKSDRGLFTINGGGTPTKATPAPKAKTPKKAAGKKTDKPADGTPGPKAVSDLLKI